MSSVCIFLREHCTGKAGNVSCFMANLSSYVETPSINSSFMRVNWLSMAEWSNEGFLKERPRRSSNYPIFQSRYLIPSLSLSVLLQRYVWTGCLFVLSDTNPWARDDEPSIIDLYWNCYSGDSSYVSAERCAWCEATAFPCTRKGMHHQLRPLSCNRSQVHSFSYPSLTFCYSYRCSGCQSDQLSVELID
jgi:hypothetical protein